METGNIGRGTWEGGIGSVDADMVTLGRGHG